MIYQRPGTRSSNRLEEGVVKETEEAGETETEIICEGKNEERKAKKEKKEALTINATNCYQFFSK